MKKVLTKEPFNDSIYTRNLGGLKVMKKKLNFKKLFLSLGIVIMTLFGAGSVYAVSEAPSTLRMGYHSYKPPISFPQTFHVKKTTGW